MTKYVCVKLIEKHGERNMFEFLTSIRIHPSNLSWNTQAKNVDVDTFYVCLHIFKK